MTNDNMKNYLKRIAKGRELELRIHKIEKFGDLWKLHVHVYSLGIVDDEYEDTGFVYLEDIEEFDQRKSLDKFVLS